MSLSDHSGSSWGRSQPALVNGAAGAVTAPWHRPVAVIGFTVVREKIVEIDIFVDPERLRRLDLRAVLDG